MTKRFSRVYLVLVLSAVISLVGATQAFAQQSKTFAAGLNAPMGVLVDDHGVVWVVDSGIGGEEDMAFPDPDTGVMSTVKYGETSRILRFDRDGNQTEVATLPSIRTASGETLGGGRLAMVDGTVYVTSGTWRIEAGETPSTHMSSIVKIVDGQAHEVVNTFDIERKENPDGFLVDSNPFGLVMGPDGKLWITDSAANTLLTADPKSGKLAVKALFDGLASPIPNPNRNNEMKADPVPTGIVFGDDGRAYVAFLSGFPFVPGSAKVVTVASDGTVADYATGLTMLIDLQKGPDGALYAVSFGQFTQQGPQPNSGALVRIREGTASEVIAGELSFPTSVAFSASGDAYVTTNGVGAPGSGEVLLFAGLAARK